ncbi:MAG: hypothetical protein LBR25_05555 [Erysipelotrichaceae bacterium]|jgi:hypothetical protein|nr:hypothetical protein [Erysipelotrichaceae bacterium]
MKGISVAKARTFLFGIMMSVMILTMGIGILIFGRQIFIGQTYEVFLTAVLVFAPVIFVMADAFAIELKWILLRWHHNRQK